MNPGKQIPTFKMHQWNLGAYDFGRHPSTEDDAESPVEHSYDTPPHLSPGPFLDGLHQTQNSQYHPVGN